MSATSSAITSSTNNRRFPPDRVWPLGSVLLRKYTGNTRLGRSCTVVHHQIGRFYGPFGRSVCGRNRKYDRGTGDFTSAEEPVFCAHRSLARGHIDGQNSRNTHERIRIFRCHCARCWCYVRRPPAVIIKSLQICLTCGWQPTLYVCPFRDRNSVREVVIKTR